MHISSAIPGQVGLMIDLTIIEAYIFSVVMFSFFFDVACSQIACLSMCIRKVSEGKVSRGALHLFEYAYDWVCTLQQPVQPNAGTESRARPAGGAGMQRCFPPAVETQDQRPN